MRAPVVHATTLVTNALIEGKTARAALVTNRGFADTLLIRNEHRYDMYDLQIEFPEPPIPRSLTFELDERTTAEGVVLQAPDAGRHRRAWPTSSGRSGVEAVAVCFLHAYANPANERTVAEVLAERPRRAGVRVERGGAADPRVPAHGHDGVQRVDDAGGRARTSTSSSAGSPTRASAAGC